MNKKNETKPARELTEKLLAMAAACAANLPKGEAKEYPRFNNLRTANSYGEFTWDFKRRKGRLTAVIALFCPQAAPETSGLTLWNTCKSNCALRRRHFETH